MGDTELSVPNQRENWAWIEPPKVLSQVVVSVVQDWFRSVWNSLQFWVVLQSMASPGEVLAIAVCKRVGCLTRVLPACVGGLPGYDEQIGPVMEIVLVGTTDECRLGDSPAVKAVDGRSGQSVVARGGNIDAIAIIVGTCSGRVARVQATIGKEAGVRSHISCTAPRKQWCVVFLECYIG